MTTASLRRAAVDAVGDRFFYGWVVLGIAGLGIFASGPGQSHTFSVFVAPIAEGLGIASASVASAYAFATLVAALGLPYMGRLVDRYGPRRMSVVVIVLLGIACMVFGAAANMLWLALGFACLRFLGQGSLMLNCSNFVAQWFDRRRGFAMSLMALGFAVSMAVHPPLGQWLIDQFGWRQAWVALGLITWALMLPPLLLLAHDKPEDLGLNPDGDAAEPIDPAQPTGNGRWRAGLTLREALATSTFYVLSLGMLSISMLVTALHFYQVSIFGEQGLSAQVAARIFPVSAVTMVACMPLVGRLLDRFDTRFMFALGLAVTSTSLVLASLVHDLPTALVYAVVFGFNNAWSMTLFGYVWARYFGRRHLGSVQGAGQMVGVVGASLGPVPLGIAFDLTGSFADVIRLLALFPVVCALLALAFLRVPATLQNAQPAR
jgi:MFS family permease